MTAQKWSAGPVRNQSPGGQGGARWVGGEDRPAFPSGQNRNPPKTQCGGWKGDRLLHHLLNQEFFFKQGEAGQNRMWWGGRPPPPTTAFSQALDIKNFGVYQLYTQIYKSKNWGRKLVVPEIRDGTKHVVWVGFPLQFHLCVSSLSCPGTLANAQNYPTRSRGPRRNSPAAKARHRAGICPERWAGLPGTPALEAP